MKFLNRSIALLVCAGCTWSVLAQAQQKMLYVTNNQGDPASVSALRINEEGTLALVGTFNGGPVPTDCTLTGGGQYLLIINAATAGNPASLRALRALPDGSLGTGIAPVPIGDGPLSVTATSTNIVLVASASSKTLQSFLITAGALTPVATVPAGAFPTKVVASPNGNFAYCMGPNGTEDILIFAIAPGGALIRIGQVDVPGNGAFSATMHPSGQSLYVSTGQSNTLLNYAVNTFTGALTFAGTVTTGGNSVVETAVDPAGTWLASAHVLSDTVRLSRLNPDRTITTTAQSYLIRQDVRDVVTDGRTVYVTDETPLGGGQVGILSYRVNDNGTLSALGPAVQSGSIRPQFMAIWQPKPRCFGDANLDGTVNFADISSVLANLNGLGPIGDADGDGFATFADVNAILSNEGPCN
jgi:6-phosphogluconolactonase (cycloisomerase 2 family)